MDNVAHHIENDTSKTATLVVATMTSFLIPFMSSSINVALPSIGKELMMDAILLSWVATSYILAAAVFLVPFGRIADIYGRKRILTYGTVIFTISSFLSALSTSATMLITFRILQGIGSAMVFGTGVAILSSVFPVEERGKALGVNVAATYLGLSLGPFLGGLLTQHFSWRGIFLVNVPLGLVVILFIFWKLKGEWAEAKGEKFDFIGSIIYGLAFVMIMYGFSLLPAMSGVWLTLAGVLGILAFGRWEMRVMNPVFNLNLFRHNTTFTFSNLAALINYSATSAVTFLMSLYLQYTKGLSPQNAGLILVSQPLVMAIVSPFAGRISDRVEPRIIASIGMLLTSIGLLLFVFLSAETTLGFIIISLIILGFGFALFSSPNMNAIMGSVEKRFYGVSSATLGTMRLTGQMLSMGIVMLIFATYIGRVQITPEYYPLFLTSVKIAFIIFATLCFGGIFASLARGKIR
jgi:EmrB/QacA subfamily drug resistance transporter